MKKVLSIISILLVILILFSSCASPYAINIGHDALHGLLPKVAIGIRSDKSEFDKDDVTLDFSFGDVNDDIIDYIQIGGISAEKCPIVCVGVYFYNAKYMDATFEYVEDSYASQNILFEDYKEIEGWHFVKEITPEDYEENYKVQSNYWGHTKYDHTETLTIPKETFELTTGYVCFGVHLIAYIPSENSYIVTVDYGDRRGVKYEKLENGKVKISDAGMTLFSTDVPR